MKFLIFATIVTRLRKEGLSSCRVKEKGIGVTRRVTKSNRIVRVAVYTIKMPHVADAFRDYPHSEPFSSVYRFI